MRRMNYPRFDKPVNFGIFDVAQSNFVMNDIPEPGFYFVVINDTEALQQYSCTFTVKMGIDTHGGWYAGTTEQVYLDYNPEYGNVISISGANPDPVHEGATIELYKLN